VGAEVLPTGVTAAVNWTLAPGRATRLAGRFEFNVAAATAPTVTVTLDELLDCQLALFESNFRLNVWLPALRG
jgi:hypothetical protein